MISSLNSLSRRLSWATLPVFLALWGATACDRPAPEAETSRETPRPTPASVRLYSIRGRVELADGENPAGVQVFCAGTSYAAWADPEGNYVISSVPPGRYRLFARRDGYEAIGLGEVTLSPLATGAGEAVFQAEAARLQPLTPRGAADSDALALRPAPSLGVLTGQVALRDGQPPDQVRVALEGTALSATVRRDGRFALVNVQPGRYRAVFERSGYESAVVAVDIQADQVTQLPQVVTLSPGGAESEGLSIVGRILFLDAQGRIVERVDGAQVTVEETLQTVGAGPDGQFLFERLAPGRYTLAASAPGYARRDKTVVELRRDAGLAVVYLYQEGPVVAEKGAVTGRVRLADAAGQSAAGTQAALAGTSHIAMTGSDGRFQLAELGADRYTLLLNRQGYKTLERAVTVEAGKTTDLGEIVLERDVVKPKVLFTSPGDGAKGVRIEPAVVAQVGFNKAMRVGTIKTALRIEPACDFSVRSGVIGPGASKDTREVLEIVFNNARTRSPMRFRTTYRVQLTTAAQDAEGLSLEAPYTFSFTTGGLAILSTWPANGARDVDIDARTPLLVRFNGVVRSDTLSRRTIIFSPEPFSLPTLIPTRPNRQTGWTDVELLVVWQFDTDYTVTFGTGIVAEDGTPLDELFRLRFRTAPQRQIEEGVTLPRAY